MVLRDDGLSQLASFSVPAETHGGIKDAEKLLKKSRIIRSADSSSKFLQNAFGAVKGSLAILGRSFKPHHDAHDTLRRRRVLALHWTQRCR